MNRGALSKKFYRLSVFVALVPLLIVIFMLYYFSGAWTMPGLAVPVLGYLLFSGGLGVLVHIYNRKTTHLAMQIDVFKQESQKRNTELDTLREIIEPARDGLSAEELLALLLDKAMKVIGVLNGSVFLVDPGEPEGLRLIVAKPSVVLNSTGGSPKEGRYSFVKSVIESGQTLRITDIETDPRTHKFNDPKYGAPSFISLPVYKNKRVVAVMNLANKENGGIFTEGDERILTIMLGVIGVGIENIGLRNHVLQQAMDIKKKTNPART